MCARFPWLLLFTRIRRFRSNCLKRNSFFSIFVWDSPLNPLKAWLLPSWRNHKFFVLKKLTNILTTSLTQLIRLSISIVNWRSLYRQNKTASSLENNICWIKKKCKRLIAINNKIAYVLYWKYKMCLLQIPVNFSFVVVSISIFVKDL